MNASIKLLSSQSITKKGFPIVVEIFYTTKLRIRKTIGHSYKEDWDHHNNTILQSHQEYHYLLPTILDYKAKVSKINANHTPYEEAIKLIEYSTPKKYLKSTYLLHFFDVIITEKAANKQDTTLFESVKVDLSNFIPEDFLINDITYDWLNSYKLSKLGPNVSGAGAMSYLRIIRTVYKEAQRRESLNIKKDNPFSGVIKEIAPKKKELITREDFKKLYNYQPKISTTEASKQIMERRIMLSIFQFLIGGIDFVDLSLLKWDKLINNRISFNRFKNRNKPRSANIEVNVLLNDEALSVIKKYGTKKNDRIFSFIPNRTQHKKEYDEYRNRYNRTLKTVCKDLNIPNISSKTMRYVFRTFAGELLIHDLIVMQIQGHKPVSNVVTYRYQGRIPNHIQDEQHLKILDFLNPGKE